MMCRERVFRECRKPFTISQSSRNMRRRRARRTGRSMRTIRGAPSMLRSIPEVSPRRDLELKGLARGLLKRPKDAESVELRSAQISNGP